MQHRIFYDIWANSDAYVYLFRIPVPGKPGS